MSIVLIGSLKTSRLWHCDRKGWESLKENARAEYKRLRGGIYGQHDQKSTGTPESKKPAIRLVSLNSGAGLGIISTANALFIIGFVGISCKQRPHEGPQK